MTRAFFFFLVLGGCGIGCGIANGFGVANPAQAPVDCFDDVSTGAFDIALNDDLERTTCSCTVGGSEFGAANGAACGADTPETKCCVLGDFPGDGAGQCQCFDYACRALLVTGGDDPDCGCGVAATDAVVQLPENADGAVDADQCNGDTCCDFGSSCACFSQLRVPGFCEDRGGTDAGNNCRADALTCPGPFAGEVAEEVDACF